MVNNCKTLVNRLIQALLLKKQVLTTDVVGPREILEDGKYGVIIPNDDKAVIEALEDILKNKNKYDYLKKNLLNYKGDNEKIMGQTLKLLDL